MGENIEGVLLTGLKIVENEKGDVLHAINEESVGFKRFGEAYFSFVKKGVAKGWKRHNKISLNIVVPIGTIRFSLFDERVNSCSKGNECQITLSARGNYSRLTIPPGVWVAFEGIEDTNMLLNVIPEIHDPLESDNREIDRIPLKF